ncbi:peptidoglycan DD-metalloendopeptidase family protein [uncultured Thiodictyon sp.]|uniref:peptidoglycan DD-metalloendopeptidase family protein n=1 Tax=uncultured Thiodictyon sp. TaxID=1846217 RepID=UPI0025CC2E1A|nr:peptidoglycan DD-metalloendopeptidase family protein [uncultured Thiodictyon sp.]
MIPHHRPSRPRSVVAPPQRRDVGGPWVGRWWPALWAGILVALLGLTGCAGTSGPAPVVGWEGARTTRPTRSVRAPIPKGYQRVRAGDSLGSIAERRHVSVQQLIDWNRLKPPYRLYRGKLLRVAPPRPRRTSRAARPRGGSTAHGSARTAKRPVAVESAPTPGRRGAASGVDWAWPLAGAVKQGFRAGDPASSGLRIGCRPGEEVRAAAAGRVAYSGSGLKGYGNLIIVKHNQDYLSAYGFNRQLLAKEGDRVKRGQALAECGEGPDGTPLLHFEVRRDGTAVNPLLYLPPRK